MGLIQRVSDLVRANLNDLIDKAEEPVKLLRQVVRKLDDRILLLRCRVRTAAARSEALKHRMEEKGRDTAFWLARAEKAVDLKEDDRARRALVQKRRLEKEKKELEKTWWRACREQEDLEKKLAELENRAQEARRLKEAVLAKKGVEWSNRPFLPKPPPVPKTAEEGFARMEVEEELQRLKARRKGEGERSVKERP